MEMFIRRINNLTKIWSRSRTFRNK